MPTPLKITLPPELEQQMLHNAQKQNTTIESLVLQAFQKDYGINDDLLVLNMDILLNDYQHFFDKLQQKYPAQIPDSAIPGIIDAEFQELEKTQPQRWQHFLSLQRLWNGDKKAELIGGEHFTEENVWGKAAIAFLEGITEDLEYDNR
jgi:hypothetical protein